jgi:hypothetical protein
MHHRQSPLAKSTHRFSMKNGVDLVIAWNLVCKYRAKARRVKAESPPNHKIAKA